ncbi:MAG: hypothetical protein ACRESG_08440, partial [Gammaproteobacteria bacterium]
VFNVLSVKRAIPGRLPLVTFLVRTRKVTRRAGANPRVLKRLLVLLCRDFVNVVLRQDHQRRGLGLNGHL